jgi:hypothetical protein
MANGNRTVNLIKTPFTFNTFCHLLSVFYMKATTKNDLKTRRLVTLKRAIINAIALFNQD